jgi:hypothetical protein
MPELTRLKITFGEMRASGVRGLLVYCSDYKCSHSTAPFVNCFTYAERGLIYQAPVCNGHWRSPNGCYFEFSFPRNRTECRRRNGPNQHHRLRNRIAPFVTLPNSALNLSDRKPAGVNRALTSHRPDERPSELTRNSSCQNTGGVKDSPPLGGVLPTAAWQRPIARSKKIATATWWLQPQSERQPRWSWPCQFLAEIALGASKHPLNSLAGLPLADLRHPN